MTLTEMIAEIKKDGAGYWTDAGVSVVSDAMLTRYVQQIVAEFSRFYPREQVYEVTIDYEVTDEAFTTAAAAGTYVELANKPIDWDSETVTIVGGGTTYTRDTDYTMDYSNGKITHISGGSMANSTGYEIDYDKSRTTIDISSLSANRIERVEYPVGMIPKSKCDWKLWGDLLEITNLEREAQQAFVDNYHIAIWYYTVHTAPTASADGTYPEYFDEAIIRGAEAMVYRAAGDYFSSQLKSSTTYVDFADIRADLQTWLDGYATAFSSWIDTTTGNPNVEDFLETGDDKINTVNTGGRVAELYNEYSLTCIQVATLLKENYDNLLDVARIKDTSMIQMMGFIDKLKAKADESYAEFYRLLQYPGRKLD
ncbi:MAG: hypothetical protein SVY53_05335 [Chloroflexota bacterium]|nr:hypothetical protein [Chloroflexota bacterium]